jgi:hypothetical protein
MLPISFSARAQRTGHFLTWKLSVKYIVVSMGEKGNTYRVLMGKPERKIPLGRPKRRWRDNIKIDLR